jgi:hypothetical protein
MDMEFEEQSAAIRQMKELLRDQSKFRAKLDRVVRRIETSSQRTARLAERNRTRKNPAAKNRPAEGNGNGESHGNGNGNGNGNGVAPSENGEHNGDGELQAAGASTFVPGAS